MLHGHILNFAGQELTVLVAKCEYLFRKMGMDMDAHLIVIQRNHQGITQLRQVLFKFPVIKYAPVIQKLQQNLCTITVQKGAVPVKGIVIYALRSLLMLQSLHTLSVKIFFHTLK